MKNKWITSIFAILLINFKSVISKDAILYIGVLSFSNMSTALMLNGVLNIGIFIFFAKLKASRCHLNGVCVFFYNSQIKRKSHVDPKEV